MTTFLQKITLALLFLFAVPSAGLTIARQPINIPATQIKDIEIDVVNGYLFFRAGAKNLVWWIEDDRFRRIQAVALVAEQLQKCKSIEVITAAAAPRDASYKRKGILYEQISSLIIKTHAPSK